MKKQEEWVYWYIYIHTYIYMFAEIVKESVIETNGILWDEYTKETFCQL